MASKVALGNHLAQRRRVDLNFMTAGSLPEGRRSQSSPLAEFDFSLAIPEGHRYEFNARRTAV